jgi:hypothetical protein
MVLSVGAPFTRLEPAKRFGSGRLLLYRSLDRYLLFKNCN